MAMSGARQPDFDMASLGMGYRLEAFSPPRIVEEAFRRMRSRPDNPIWISMAPEELVLERARELERVRREIGHDACEKRFPLYGVPFAVKDNIDVQGMETTAGCPDFAYRAKESATVVRLLEEAGALCMGKTNLDQFATGLVGIRSPYGACRNAFDPDYISGGSSAGSAVAVALGQVGFALGTDTAGSGRVPAAFNNIVGLKPTRGVVSCHGVVPACRTLDCVSIFALTCRDAARVFDVVAAYDPRDAFSRKTGSVSPARCRGDGFTFGYVAPAQQEFYGDHQARERYTLALRRLEDIGGRGVAVDIEILREAAAMLYEGPWVAERSAAVGELLENKPSSLLPVTRAVIDSGRRFSAVQVFEAMYHLEELRRESKAIWRDMDVLVLPTAPTIYTVSAVEADPLETNKRLGYYTNFVNLLDLAALAVPVGFRADGLPSGVTLCAPAFCEAPLLDIGGRLHHASSLGPGTAGDNQALPVRDTVPVAAPGKMFDMAVVGAHLRGLPLNHELLEAGGTFVRVCRTRDCYRLYHLAGSSPPKPGMVRVADSGVAMELEIWRLPSEGFASFVAGIPEPLGIGSICLEDGSSVKGFLCEAVAVEGALDISEYGGWRNYIQSGCKTVP